MSTRRVFYNKKKVFIHFVPIQLLRRYSALTSHQDTSSNLAGVTSLPTLTTFSEKLNKGLRTSLWFVCNWGEIYSRGPWLQGLAGGIGRSCCSLLAPATFLPSACAQAVTPSLTGLRGCLPRDSKFSSQVGPLSCRYWPCN